MAYITGAEANQIQKMDAGSYGGRGDLLRHTLYDTNTITTGPIQEFFTTPQSGTKPVTDTNLRDTGKLPAGQSFITMAVEFSFINVGTADALTTQAQHFLNAFQQSQFKLNIAGREFDLEVSGNEFLPGMIQSGVGTGATPQTGFFIKDGRIRVKPNIVLGELVSFKVVQTYNTQNAGVLASLTALAAANCRVQYRLCGMLKRLK
jgi:hypothetical protein